MPNVTLSTIAAKVGVSKNSVSLALRGDPQIPPSTRDRIRRVAQELGYRPNPVIAHLMAQLRASRTPRLQAKLALVNAHRDPDALRKHPTIPTYVEGCERRAASRGYGFDRFWLHDPTLTAASFLRILRTRGIKGIILVGLMEQNQLPGHLRPHFRPLGYLPAPEASQAFSAADVLALPFSDGISERRTTLMAGLQHGLAVVTTVGHNTGSELRTANWLALTPAEDGFAFSRVVGDLLRDGPTRARLAVAGKAKHDRDFAWPVIANRLRQCLKK